MNNNQSLEMNAKNKTDKFIMIYRIGGTARCKWVKTNVIHDSIEAARAFALDTERIGYKALIKEVGQLERIGMPIGWDSTTPVNEWRLGKDGWWNHEPPPKAIRGNGC